MGHVIQNITRLSECDFIDYVRNVETGDHSLAVFWLGQAGFLFKTPQGRLIAVDPYLSDCCERIAGFRRITPPVMTIDEFTVDDLLVSHEHPDHFDIDLITRWKDRPGSRIHGPASCRRLALEAGLPDDRFITLEEGRCVPFPEFDLLPVKADHGALSPDALGFIFDFGFVRVYFAGDTAYSPQILNRAIECKPEIALLPINGEFGNMNAKEAARLAKDAGVKVLIPCHFWTFVEHGSCPLELKQEMENLPEIQLLFLAQGGCCIYRAAQ